MHHINQNISESRPKYKIELNVSDTLIETIGWLLILLMWGFTLTYYATLPEIIPIHYNIKGEADGFGNKNYIMILPCLASVLYIAMTILNRYPHIFNFPTPITQENALRQYTLATRLIRTLKLLLVIIFGYIHFATIQNSLGMQNGLNSWFLPVSMIMIFLPLGFYIWKAVKG